MARPITDLEGNTLPTHILTKSGADALYAPIGSVGGGGGSATWGGITGTLSAQTDLNTALAGKASNIVFTLGANGLVPASGGGTINYLRADGTWHDPVFGTHTLNVPIGDAAGSVHGPWLQINNPNNPGYGTYSVYDNTGDVVGTNDISHGILTRHKSIRTGAAWGQWHVSASPLNPSSGFGNAPASAQTFAAVMAEYNPISRHSDCGIAYDARHWTNWHAGIDMVPETKDFWSELGGQRRGYNIPFAYGIAKSPLANSDLQDHARSYFGLFARPNAIAANGAFLFSTGYQDYVTSVTIAAAGTGYTAGDILTFNSGLATSQNQNTTVEVVSVSSGAITAVRVYDAGWYQQTFASTVGVTGGTGTGATFTYTLSTSASAPRAWGGMAGRWSYGLDAHKWSTGSSFTGTATFTGGMLRAPNNQNVIVARNAGDTADVTILKLNSSDQIEAGQASTTLSLLGTPVAATATADTNSTQLATTAFVQNSKSVVAVAGLTGGAVTLSAAQCGSSIITLAGTLTSNLTLSFGSGVAAYFNRSFIVVNNTTGSFTVTLQACATSPFNNVTVAQSTSILVFTNGASILLADWAANQAAFNSAAKGVVPASGGGTTNFLRADGTWAAPPASGAGTTTNAVTFNSSGSGAVSGSTFDGSVARTISYNTIGAQVAGSYATGGGTATGTNTGDQTITLTGAVTGSGTGSFSTTLASSIVGLSNMANVATGTVFYRKTAATGAPEVQTLATLKTDLGLTGTNSGDQTITLTGDVTGSGTGSFATAIGSNKVTRAMLAATAGATILGATAAGNVADLTAAQAKTFLSIASTDVSGLAAIASSGSGADLSANSVTLGKIATQATSTVLGNVSGSAAAPSALTATQLTALMNAFTSSLSGAVPASGGGTTNFLRADGTWAAPTASAAWGSITGTLSSQTDLNTALGAKAPTASPTFTGTVTLPAVSQTGAFNSSESYSVKLASVTNFANTSPTATVLTASATGTTSFDGVVLSAGDVVLLTAQTLAKQNGIYTVTTAGATGVATVLTRVPELNTWANVARGFKAQVQAGGSTVIGGTLYISQPGASVSAGTLGTDAISVSRVVWNGDSPTFPLLNANTIQTTSGNTLSLTTTADISMSTGTGMSINTTSSTATHDFKVNSGMVFQVVPAGIKLSLGKIALPTYTNSSPVNGDIWFDGTSLQVHGALVASGAVSGSNLTGTNTGDQFTSIATGSIIGNNSGSTGAATALTAAQTRALLNTSIGFNTYCNSTPDNSMVVGGWIASTAFTISATNSVAKATVAATASSVFTIQVNGSTAGTFTFAAAGTTATVSITSGSVTAGQIVTILGPSTADTTLANIAFRVSE